MVSHKTYGMGAGLGSKAYRSLRPPLGVRLCTGFKEGFLVKPLVFCFEYKYLRNPNKNLFLETLLTPFQTRLQIF